MLIVIFDDDCKFKVVERIKSSNRFGLSISCMLAQCALKVDVKNTPFSHSENKICLNELTNFRF